MRIPTVVEGLEEVEETVTINDTTYLLGQLPRSDAPGNFISTHKPNVHAVVNESLQTLEIYLPTGGVIVASIIDVVGDINPWGNV